MKRLIAAALLVVSATPAIASPTDDLATVIADHWAWYLSVNPEQATSLGERRYDAQISDLSLAQADREAAAAKRFLERLRAIPDAALSPAEQVNKGVLARVLGGQVEGNGFGERQMLFTTYYGWHQGFAELASNLPFRARADYESYLTRLAQYPRQNGAALKITRDAVTQGYVQPCDALAGYEKTIIGVIA